MYSKNRLNRGQALVETSFLVLTVTSIFVFLIQGAIVWGRSMAVVDLAYQGARYAAVNPSYSESTVIAFMKQIAPSSINQNGGNQLAISVVGSGTPRGLGTAVTVSVTYTIPTPLMYGFPTSLSATNTTMTD